MSEPTTIRVKDGGFVSLERGPEEKDWIRLEVTTVEAGEQPDLTPTRRRRGVARDRRDGHHGRSPSRVRSRWRCRT